MALDTTLLDELAKRLAVAEACGCAAVVTAAWLRAFIHDARAQQSANPSGELSELETACAHGKARCRECKEVARRELIRLNPYARHGIDNKTPDDALGRFLFGIRYYAGMLEDDDNWSHSIGHIQECCAEFDIAITARAANTLALATGAACPESSR